MKGGRKSHRISQPRLRHERPRSTSTGSLSAAGQLGLQGPGQAMAQGIDGGDAARRQDRRSEIFLDGFPNMQVLDPLHIGQNVRRCRLRPAPNIPRAPSIRRPRTHCHSVKDYVTRDLFEEAHARRGKSHRLPETQLDLVGKLASSSTPSITSAARRRLMPARSPLAPNATKV